jgi:hypothetical protein
MTAAHLSCDIVLGLLVVSATASYAAELPDGAARPLVTAVCGSCHGLEIVTERRWSESRWRETVDAMVVRGAALKKDEITLVVSYLTQHFGPRPGASDRGRVLVEDICSLCHELDRVRAQELTRAQWSTEIKGMISEGAPVTDEEFELIVDYLASRYGPRK